MTGFFDQQDPFERDLPTDLPTEVFGQAPAVHAPVRTVRRVGRRAAVAAGSLAAGALAAGGAAFAIVGSGGQDASVAVAAVGAAPSKTAEVTLDPSTRTEDVSRADLRPGTCVRLDADALAAVEQARAAGADKAADGRKVTVQLADGAVSVPVSALKVVRCKVPASSSSTKASSSASSSARKPAPASTSTRPKTSSTSRPASTTSKPRTTTSTKPRTTTSTKPKTTTTTTKSPTPKPTTTSGS